MDLEKTAFLRALLSDPHLGRVASRFNLTQSALSKRVRALEAEVGFPLFERRGPRGLFPLPAAHEFSELLDRVSGAWKKGVERIHQKAHTVNEFTVVGPAFFMKEVFLPWWSKRPQKFQHLQIEVRIPALRIASLEALRLQADAVILEQNQELQDYVCRKIFREQWGIVRSQASLGQSISKLKWGTYSKQINPVDQWLVQTGKLANPDYSVFWEDLSSLAEWVGSGNDRAAVLPEHAAQDLLKSNRVVFESLGPRAAKFLYLAYPVKTEHKELLRSLSQIQKQL